MKMSVYLQTATSHRGQRESRAIGQKLSLTTTTSISGG